MLTRFRSKNSKESERKGDKLWKKDSSFVRHDEEFNGLYNSCFYCALTDLSGNNIQKNKGGYWETHRL